MSIVESGRGVPKQEFGSGELCLRSSDSCTVSVFYNCGVRPAANSALALASLGGGFNKRSESFSRALPGAYGDSMIKRLVLGDAGFGLPAGIAGRMLPPIGIGLGF